MISDQPFDFNYDPPPEIPPVEQSHLEPPPVEQSHLEPPPVEQSHFDPPPVEHSMVDSTQFGPPQSTSPPDYISSGVFNPDWHEGPAIGPLTQGQLEADKKSMEDQDPPDNFSWFPVEDLDLRADQLPQIERVIEVPPASIFLEPGDPLNYTPPPPPPPSQSTSPPDHISSGVFNPDWHEGPAIGPLTQGQLEADKKSMEDRENYHRQLEEFLDHWSNHPPPEEGYEPTPPEPPLH
jgi:hypothetical protein